MAANTYNIDIDGYWREPNISRIPSKSGVYFVYECSHNLAEKTVSLKKLIYIGESKDVNDRIKNHEKWKDWRKHVRNGNELCFSFGAVAENDRNRVEAAYIYKHKPPVNTDYVNSFPFDTSCISPLKVRT